MFRSLKENVQFYPIHHGFEPNLDETGLHATQRWLMNQVFFDSEADVVLQPVNLNTPHAFQSLCLNLVRAWTDPELRRGYIPQTPTTLQGAEHVAKTYWLSDAQRLVYIYGQYADMLAQGWGGYMTFRLAEQTQVTYGIFDPSEGNKGLTTKALTLALQAIEYACFTFGLPLSEHATTVSDVNIPSMRVLIKNGYQLSPEVPASIAPIGLGGQNLEACRAPSLAVNPTQHPGW